MAQFDPVGYVRNNRNQLSVAERKPDRFPPVSGNHQFYYSINNKDFLPQGEKFTATFGNWKGPKIGLFSYHEKGEGGAAYFDWFHYLYDGPKHAASDSK